MLFNKSFLLIVPFILYGYNVKINTDIKPDKNAVAIQKKIILNGKYLPDKFVSSFIKDNDKFAKAFIKQYGIDKDTKTALQLSINQTLTKLLRNKLKEKYAPNEAAIKSFYYDHYDEFKPETKVSVSTITLASLSQADKLYSILKKDPKKFDELAKKYSIDKHTDFVNVQMSKFEFPLREWIRKAKPGDISQPVKIGNLYFIDRLNKKETVKPTYKNLKPFIKNILVNIYVNKKMKKMIEDIQ